MTLYGDNHAFDWSTVDYTVDANGERTVVGYKAAMATKHRIRWFGIDPTTRERIPRNRHMSGGDWGWDVEYEKKSEISSSNG